MGEDDVAFDDTTINTKIAKMDIDAMFFDGEDNDGVSAGYAAKPLNLNSSSSCVFPAMNSIADAKQPLSFIAEESDANKTGKKDSGFVVFDDFSVIKSVCIFVCIVI